MTETPNPGSPQAVEQGCTCAILDNGYGFGYLIKDQFYINLECPLHGKKEND